MCAPANKCSSEEGLIHMQNHFDTDGYSKLKMIHSTNLLLLWIQSILVLPQKIYFNRQLKRVGPMCGKINWFPSLVCREGELQEKGAGTAMEDWKVGEEINWSHYVAVCYLGWRSSRESELSLQMKPESELCEMTPTPKEFWAKQTSQSYQITHSHPFWWRSWKTQWI